MRVLLSHWVTLVFVVLTGYKLLIEDWRGYLIAGFALVWIANLYMSLYARLRLGIKSERLEIQLTEEEHEEAAEHSSPHAPPPLETRSKSPARTRSSLDVRQPRAVPYDGVGLATSAHDESGR